MVEAEWGPPGIPHHSTLPGSPSMNPGRKSPDFVPKLCLLTQIPLEEHDDP